MPHIERTRPTLAAPAPLTRMANDTACPLVAPPLAVAAPGARGAISLIGATTGPARGEPGAFATPETHVAAWVVPDGSRRTAGRVGLAGAMIVFLWGRVFPAAGVSVSRKGAHATRTTHDDPYVQPARCAW